MNSQPPKLADRLLEWYCHPELFEDLQGDLYEQYNKNIEKSRFTASLIYWIDVIKFIRLYTVQKPQILNNMHFLTLFQNHLKTSVRSIKRNRLFSMINVVGLAVSMSIGILIITFYQELQEFDRFHTKNERIHRVIATLNYLNDPPQDFASTSHVTYQLLNEKFPEVEKTVILSRDKFSGDAVTTKKVIPLSGFWASESFFDIFSFNLIKGNPETALSEANSVVLTEKGAEKIFGEEEAMGQSLTIRDIEYVVTGIMEDIPKNSHLKFEALGSYQTYVLANQDTERFKRWNNMWRQYVYVLLNKGASIDQFNDKLAGISEKQNEKEKNYKIHLSTQNLAEIIPGQQLSNNAGINFEESIIVFLGTLIVIVILTACFNYTNLAIARAIKRTKEVGIRKIVGASRGHVFSQFIFESIIISLLAFILSYFMFIWIKPGFLNMGNEMDQLVDLDFKWANLPIYLGFALIVGLIAGLAPALIISRLKILQTLQHNTSIKLFGKVAIRKALITFQFVLSMTFITSVFVLENQYQYAINFDLGYQTENIINVKLHDNDPEIVKSALSQLHEVQDISASSFVMSIGNSRSTEVKYKDPLDSATIWLLHIDDRFLANHEIPIIAGANFKPNLGTEEPRDVIVNQKLLKRFSIESKEAAIGENLKIDGDDFKIIGVIPDFHYNSLTDELGPFMFQNNPDDWYILNLKVKTDDIVSTMDRLEEQWKTVDQVHDFEAEFLDDDIHDNYSEIQLIMTVIGFMAFLAISIVLLGLLGMAVYSTETRVKEISIRKILGASESSLIYHLSKGFLVLMIIAAAISMPLTYFFFDQVVLSDIVYNAGVSLIDLSTGAVLMTVVGLTTIGLQCASVIKLNPADNLRDE